jgi:hypothetical protein
MDELFEREDITPEEYYAFFGLTREEFWELYDDVVDIGESPYGFFDSMRRELQTE